MKKHVIFDIDGTLLDSEESVLLSLQETVLMKKGKHMETEELKFALGIPSEAALRRLGFAEEELAETVQFWGTLTPSYHKYMRIFPGIRETLTALKEKGIRLGIVTSRNRPEYEKDFLPFGLEPFFDTVICADDTIRHKPDGEPVREYLRRQKAQP